MTIPEGGCHKETPPSSGKLESNCMPLVVSDFSNPVLRRQRQIDICKFKANLVCIMRSITAMATERNHVLKERK